MYEGPGCSLQVSLKQLESHWGEGHIELRIIGVALYRDAMSSNECGHWSAVVREERRSQH
jgi:hypothetical protein